MDGKVFIIAEAGVNHNGSLGIAKRLIDVASKAGADAIKFQTFDAAAIISRSAPKAEYQKRNCDKMHTLLEIIKRLELNEKAHQLLIEYCKRKNILFVSSPFDLQSIELLKRLGLRIFKIPSGEITNLPYLRKIGTLKKKIIMSTGMASLKEIRDALNVLVSFGTKKENITVLHCNTEYPTPLEDVNLKAMLTIKEKLKIKVGYSDHTLGIEVPVAAVALGATVIEKHFTLNRLMQGPDHRASLEPEELKMMIEAIRNIEKALGNGIKRSSKSEAKNIEVVRKSIIAARNIKRGEIFTQDNIAVKRPGIGISPMKWDKIIGQLARKDFQEDEVIKI